MAENLLFFYGLLVVFVLGSMQRNIREGRGHVRQLVYTAWGLLSFSVAGAGYFALSAVSLALRA